MKTGTFLPQSVYIYYPAWTFDVTVPPVVIHHGMLYTLNLREMRMMTVATKTLRDQLLALILTGWTLGKLRLFKNDFTPSFDTVVGDFTEATFPGYALIAATTTPVTGIDAQTGNLAIVWADGCTWNAGTIVTPETVYGWYITNTAGSSVLAAGRFDTLIVVDETDDVVAITPPKAQVPLAILV